MADNGSSRIAFSIDHFNPWSLRINAKSRPAIRRGRLRFLTNDEHKAAAHVVEFHCRQAIVRTRSRFQRGPVVLTVVFRGDRRSSKHGACECMGDVDAPLKALQDAMTKAGAWSDDTQVVDVRVRKIYASVPGIDVEVSAAGDAS